MTGNKQVRVSTELVERFRAGIMFRLESRVRKEPGFREFVEGIPARDLIRFALEMAAEKLISEANIFIPGKVGIASIDSWQDAHETERERLWREFRELVTTPESDDGRERSKRQRRLSDIQARLADLGPTPVSRGGGMPPGSGRPYRPGRGEAGDG